jgi:hypothetical protein
MNIHIIQLNNNIINAAIAVAVYLWTTFAAYPLVILMLIRTHIAAGGL